MAVIQVTNQVQYYDRGYSQTRLGRVVRIEGDKAFVVFDDDMDRKETEVYLSSLELSTD